MQNYVETISIFFQRSKAYTWSVAQVLIGSLFLAACAQITIPLYPVPMTMHTFGIFMLAVMQGGKKSLSSTLLYLVFVSLGLPFLAGGVSQSLWFMGASAGYLIAFPIAAFLIGEIIERCQNPTSFKILGSLLCGQLVIYTLGVLFLMRSLSFEQSLLCGLVPFLPLAGLKLLMATSMSGLWLRWKRS